MHSLPKGRATDGKVTVTHSAHRFIVLDAWRGIAAVLVVIWHFIGDLGSQSHLHYIPFFQNAWMMVDFFFVLSGFVISHATFGKLSGAKAATAFLIRRFGRLWPLHATVLACFLALSLAKAAASHGTVPAFSPENSLTSLFYQLLLIQALNVQALDNWNAPAWSISVEFYTYFVFVAVCLSENRRFSTIWPALTLILLSLALMIGLRGSMGMNLSFDFGIFRCIYGFFVGHLTYLLWRRYKSSKPAMEWVAVALAVAFVSFIGIMPLQYFAPPVFALLVWVFAEQKGPISRLGSSAIFQCIGTWSFSIYMIHWFPLHVMPKLLAAVDSHLGTHVLLTVMTKNDAIDVVTYQMAMPNLWVGDLATLLFAGVIVLLSSVSYRFVEHPARLYFNRLAGGSSARVSQVSNAV